MVICFRELVHPFFLELRLKRIFGLGYFAMETYIILYFIAALLSGSEPC